MASSEDRRLHPASSVFKDHLLGEVIDENKMLPEGIKHLETMVSVELRLDSGDIAAADLKMGSCVKYKRGYFLPTLGDSDVYRVPLSSCPYPLSEFSAGGVFVLGRKIASLPCQEVWLQRGFLGKQTSLLLKLSETTFIKGAIHGLADEDYQNLTDTDWLLGFRSLAHFIARLRNPAGMTLAPTSTIIGVSHHDLQGYFNVFRHLRSQEHIKNKKDAIDRVIGPGTSQVLESRLSVLTALGHSKSQLELLSANRMLNIEYSCLSCINDMIGRVDIYHQSFDTKFSLKDGRLVISRGTAYWANIQWIGPMSLGSVTKANIKSFAMYLSGMQMKVIGIRATDLAASGDISGFRVEVEYGAWFFGRIHRDDATEPTMLSIAVAFPLSYVQGTLDKLGVEVHEDDGNIS